MNADFQNLAEITGLPFVRRGERMIANCYINGEPHKQKDKTYAILKEGVGIFIKENGGDDISLKEWLSIYKGGATYGAFDGAFEKHEEKKRIFADEDFTVDATLPKAYSNYLYKYLSSAFGEKRVEATFRKYFIGEYSKSDVVFWYRNEIKNFCHDAVVVYGCDGKRDKCSGGYRKLTIDKGFSSTCLFGSHLIDLKKQVAVVESEKTALIMDIVDDSKIWVATGGGMKLGGIADKGYLLYPDYDNVGSKWECVGCTVPSTERRSSGVCLLDIRGNKQMWGCAMANENIVKWWVGEDVGEGWDIGDLILKKTRNGLKNYEAD